MKRCLILKGIKSFRYGSKRYRVGEVVDLPDEFPVEKYSFLQPISEDLENYRRSKPLKVKPLMIIMSVRQIPQVKEAFKRLTFLDKVFFCNYGPPVISNIMNGWIKEHGSHYTHFIISSDDINPTPENIRQLIEDVSMFNLPSVGGWCNICYFDRQDKQGAICGACVDGAPHEDTNVTFDPVDTITLSRSSYNFVKVEWAKNHPAMYPVWFQGMACGAVSMATHKRLPFRSLLDGEGGLMQDLAFAVDCDHAGIKQFVDFRVGMNHFGTHHGKLLVGKAPTRIRFEKAKT